MAEELFKIIQMYNSTGAEVFPKTMAEIVKYGDSTVAAKLDALIAAEGQNNVLEAVKWNGEAFAITDKAVDIYSKVSTFVSEEIGKQIHMNVEVVDALPETGAKGIIYLIAHTGTGTAAGTGGDYDEYIWTGTAFELIGTTAVDLTGYATETFVQEEITKLAAVYAPISLVGRVEAIEAKVPGYDDHIADSDIHVTTADKDRWDGKQDALTAGQLAAVNSGITADKVAKYDGYDATINSKANAADVYTKDEVDGIVDDLEADIKDINDSDVMNSGITAELVGKISTNEGAISTLNGNVTDLGNNKADKVITAGGKTLSVLYFEEVTA